jgi:hypothetical protein
MTTIGMGDLSRDLIYLGQKHKDLLVETNVVRVSVKIFI